MAFPVRWLLFAVAFCGLVVAGMLDATRHWVAGIHGLFLLASLSCLVFAIYGSASQRAFAVGFLCFGVPYFALANQIVGKTPEEYLVARSALLALHPHIIRISEAPAPQNSSYLADAEQAMAIVRREGRGNVYKPGVGIVVRTVRPLETHFVQLGDAFCAILILQR